MKIVTFISKDFQENTYFLIDNNEAIIIDPGINIELIKPFILKKKLKIKYVLLTHGHYDHIVSTAAFDVVIYAHEQERLLIEDAKMNLSIFALNKKIILKNVKYYTDPIFELDNFKIFHTPGHTAGSVIIKTGNYLFTGDTLFLDTVGRSDLPTGDAEKLQQSLTIFDRFDKKTICYPGHGKPFRLLDAYKYNYFLSKKRI